MEEIIKKAIEGGWEKDGFIYAGKLHGVDLCAVLDSSFWESLGKECGWIEYRTVCCGVVSFGKGTYCKSCEKGNAPVTAKDNWKFFALKFHEINLLQGFETAVAWLKKIVIK